MIACVVWDVGLIVFRASADGEYDRYNFKDDFAGALEFLPARMAVLLSGSQVQVSRR